MTAFLARYEKGILVDSRAEGRGDLSGGGNEQQTKRAAYSNPVNEVIGGRGGKERI